MKMPEASSRPPGRTEADRAGASSTSRRCDEVGEHQVEGPPAAGHGISDRHRASGGNHPAGHPVATRVGGRGLDRDGVGVHAKHRPGTQERRCDGQDARSGADIQDPGTLQEARIRPALDAGHAQPSRGMQPRAEGHARIERQDHIPRSRMMSPPRGPDDEVLTDTQHREVLLPGGRPILLVDRLDGELADGPQPEGLEMPQVTPHRIDGSLRGGGIERREVRPQRGRLVGRLAAAAGPRPAA